MNAGLTKHVFTKSDWADVQNFNCGDRAFEQEVASWLKGADTLGTDSALNSINHSDKPCRVWLYKLDGVLVGFGSLAKTEWRWPGKNNDPKLPLTIVIWVGLQKEFQGQPLGPKEGRYSSQILDDLVAEAEQDAKTHPVLGLFVHKDNDKALKFYRDAGFSDELVQRLNKATGEIEYYKLFVILDDDALRELLASTKK